VLLAWAGLAQDKEDRVGSGDGLDLLYDPEKGGAFLDFPRGFPRSFTTRSSSSKSSFSCLRAHGLPYSLHKTEESDNQFDFRKHVQNLAYRQASGEPGRESAC
jgi:hypothetical protein